MPRKRKEIVRLIEQTRTLQTPTLDISQCQLGDLVDEVCQMEWLTELNLSHGHLAALPDAIGNLTLLTRLDLSENQLSTLPEAMTRLTNLQYLNLHRAGYGFAIPESLAAWLKTIPEVQWPDGKQPEPEVAVRTILTPDSPNRWLEWLKSALKLYGDALAMEDRGFGGYEKRAEADAWIAQIFQQVPELQEILPEFYQDFLNHRFYSYNCDSEKTLDHNPFRLPTKADEKWLAELSTAPDDSPTLTLYAEVSDSHRHIRVRNKRTGQESEVFDCEYGRCLLSNQPYAEDEIYLADCEAWLYQTGHRRYFLRAQVYDYGGDITRWYDSNDGGKTWHRQAQLTQEWLEKNRGNWPERGHIPMAG